MGTPVSASRVIVVVLAAIVLGATRPAASTLQPPATAPQDGVNGYTFSLVATLGQPSPGGDWFAHDFELQGLDDRGDIFFGSDQTCGEAEFIARRGAIERLVGCSDPLPGSGWESFFWTGGMNNVGDTVLLLATDHSSPEGRFMRVYYQGANDTALTPIVVPGAIPVPGGGTFQGTALASANRFQGRPDGFPRVKPWCLADAALLSCSDPRRDASLRGGRLRLRVPGGPAARNAMSPGRAMR